MGQDFILRNCSIRRYLIVWATFKTAIFLSYNRFSFYVGFQQIAPKRKILPALSLPYSALDMVF